MSFEFNMVPTVSLRIGDLGRWPGTRRDVGVHWSSLRGPCALGLQLWCLPWSLRPKDRIWTRKLTFVSWHSGDKVPGPEVGCQGPCWKFSPIIGKLQCCPPCPPPQFSHHLIFKKSSTEKEKCQTPATGFIW